MKTKEEIQVLAEIAFKDELNNSNQDPNWVGYGKGIDGISKDKWIELWIKGYTESEQRNQLENLFGRPLNEVYDIEKYKNPIDAINDIASGKLKPRTDLIRYSEHDLREAIKKAKKYFPEFPYGLKEGHQVRFAHNADEIVESLNEKKSNENS